MKQNSIVLLLSFCFLCLLPLPSFADKPKEQLLVVREKFLSADFEGVLVKLSVRRMENQSTLNELSSQSLQSFFIDALNKHFEAPSLQVKAVASDLPSKKMESQLLEPKKIYLFVMVDVSVGNKFAISLFSKLNNRVGKFTVYWDKAEDKQERIDAIKEALADVAKNYAYEVNCISGGLCVKRKNWLP